MNESINEIEKDLSENAELLEFMKLCNELPVDQLREIASILERDYNYSKFELVNEELDIWDCIVEELSDGLIEKILKCWDDGSGTETVTLFSLGSMVILNISNPRYDTYLKLTEAYLAANAEERADLKEKLISSSLKEIMRVLDGVIQIRGEELGKTEYKIDVKEGAMA